MSRLKTDAIRNVNASVDGITLDTSGNVAIPNELQLADKIVHTGDTNTAIRFPAADTIQFETGGSKRLELDSSGNLLINATTTFASATKLQVRGASSALSDGGQVFDIATTATATGGTRLAFGVNEDNYSWIRSYESSVGSRDIVFAGVGEYLRIDSSGRVGIGITNPAKALVIAKDSASAIIELRRTNTNTTGSIGAISWTAMDGHSVANMYALGDGDNEGAHLVFRTTSAAASNDPYNAATVERLRITSAGNVGIGCTPSNGFLEVKNTSYNGGSTGFLTLEGGGESGVMFKTSSYGNDQNKIGTNNNGHMFFRVAAGTRASLTSNGLCFNSDTAAANALDDYEEGTFSANFSTAGVSSTACTEETYIKIGRIVHFKLKLVTPSGSPSLGDLTITGLPFTMSSGNGTAQGHWQDGGSYNAVGGRIGGSQIERVNGSAFPSHGSAASWYFTGTYDVG